MAPSTEEQANVTSLIGAGMHELRTIRVGQTAVFECAAAAQPQPRIRWFKLVAARGAPSGGRHRNMQQQQQQQQQLNALVDGAPRTAAASFHHQSSGWPSSSSSSSSSGSASNNQQRIEESQLKAYLLQLDSAAASSSELASAQAFSFQRIEIPLSAQSNKG